MVLKFIRYVTPYLLRPMIWPEIRRQVVRQLKLRMPGSRRARSDAGRREAECWCAEAAVDSAEAVRRLGFSAPLIPWADRFPAEFTAARERAARCPMRLGGAGNLDLLHALCEAIEARRVLETGVAYGWSTLAILLSLKNRPGAMLFSVDLPYFRYHNDRWVGVVVPEKLRHAWKLYRMADREGVPRALKAAGTIDLAHYDSDKSAEGRLFSYRLIWQALRRGGILISDDVGDNLGFKSFCEDVGVKPVIVRHENKYQGVFVKIDEGA